MKGGELPLAGVGRSPGLYLAAVIGGTLHLAPFARVIRMCRALAFCLIVCT